MDDQLYRYSAGNFPGDPSERPQRYRHAKHEQRDWSRGASQKRQHAVKRNLKLYDTATYPQYAATIRGWNTMALATMPMVGSSGRRSFPVSAIDNGRIENRKMLSKQKINAVGTAALAPRTASASPGPHVADVSVAARQSRHGSFADR
jgi:hypothetical protein